MNKKFRKFLMYGIVFITLVIVAALLLHFAAVPCALVAAGIWWLYDHNKEAREEARQTNNAEMDMITASAVQTVLVATRKFYKMFHYMEPLSVNDLWINPSIVCKSGLRVLQFRLVKTEDSKADDYRRLQLLLQGEIERLLQSGSVSNIPGTYWTSRNGVQWPIFQIVNMKDEPLDFILQLVIVASDDTADHLNAMRNRPKNHPKSPTTDPEF